MLWHLLGGCARSFVSFHRPQHMALTHTGYQKPHPLFASLNLRHLRALPPPSFYSSILACVSPRPELLMPVRTQWIYRFYHRFRQGQG
ncbi:hypothetical protein BC826DRAFT_160028 [Russula brevipes]|nr:hypothetical protein BC826DRAFT_160028 [Russula brevipes]